MTFAEEVAADTPAIWWDTRNASGSNQPDSSGNGKTGTIVGGTTITFYLDGAVYGTNTGTPFAVDLLESASFFMGDDVFGGDGYKGLIRHGIFYDHALGPARVAAHAATALETGNLYTPPIA